MRWKDKRTNCLDHSSNACVCDNSTIAPTTDKSIFHTPLLQHSQKILTCTPVITGTQCSVCAFLSAFVFISSCICVWYRAWSHLLLKSCCYQSIRSICVFVFVYLCICVFVFMYLCICVLGAACCWNPAVARRRDALRNTLLPAQLAACRACHPQIQV